MPGRIEQAQAETLAPIRLAERGPRAVLHLRLDVSALAVEAVELARNGARATGIGGDQALDAERHVGQPTRGVEAWCDRESQIVCRRPPVIPAGCLKQRRDAGLQTPP